MNFHWFVLISTILFYIILRLYKSEIQTQTKQKAKGKSNFIYVLFLPLTFYILNFMYKIKEYTPVSKINSSNIMSVSDISEQPLLSLPYPESSIL